MPGVLEGEGKKKGKKEQKISLYWIWVTDSDRYQITA